MVAEEKFQCAYREIEKRMKALAEADGNVFLPNPEPAGPVEYVLICMEPSLGHWARSADEARARVEAGFRNFLAGIEPMILHFCVRHFLCERGQRYHITDFSKGAMLRQRAGIARGKRYDRWYTLLLGEIDLIATPDARIIAVGNAVAEHLRQRKFPREFTQVIHYSPLAARARGAHFADYEDRFRAFKDSVSLEDVLATARDVLRESRVPAEIRKQALPIIERRQLTTSRRQLIFNYKLAFEAMRS
jgi:hypothetical protein